MKNLLISLIVSAGMISSANAAVSGDAEAGKAKAAACAACHGADGNSLAGSFPKIAGQGERYLIKQMNDIKSGARSVPEMTGQLDNFTEEDIRNVAAYFASQKAAGGSANPDLLELGRKIYHFGNEKTGVPACAACHGAEGKGLSAAGFPRLAGQHAAYTEKQLEAFYSFKRTNDGDTKIMRDIASRMHETEMKAVSDYIQGLK